MIKKTILSIILFCLMASLTPVYAATVIKKEDAPLFSKKSIYSEIDVVENAGTNDSYNGLRQNDEALNKFNVVTATKEGNTFSNIWSNYKITFNDKFLNANDVYDFYADGMKFDFGIYFADWSRIAVYYTRLSKDLNVIAANFSPGAPITEYEIAGETFKHVALDVEYPYGIEKYEYYFRDVDGKLMVIELYYEDGKEISRDYIDKFTKYKE